MGEQPVFEPWRRSCEARRGENEERRGRQHRQECADKAEGDEDKAENKINATHQPQPSCKSEGLSFQPRPSRASDPNCPARVTAQVTGHVYDTSTGKFLLIPSAARFRSFDSQIAFSRRPGEGSAHAASASAEVVVGLKICLYWSRDGRYVPGLRASGLLPALAKVFAWRVVTWVAW